MNVALGRLSPGGSAIPLSLGFEGAASGDRVDVLRAGLARLLGPGAFSFHASGREALRALFAALAAESGRAEVVVPAYACFSIPAAAVAAGLRVRLVDVTPLGRIDPAALAALPLDAVAAVVACNLLGVGEPLTDIAALCAGSGMTLVDDAAQSLGARAGDGAVGARGAVGMLSFGRGKPLSALGGGALYWSGRDPVVPAQAPEAPRTGVALARALAYDVARLPWVFRLLAAIPALAIGETHYDTGFARGPLDGASLWLAAGLVGDLEAANARRAAVASDLAERVRTRSGFQPLVAAAGEQGVYPRLGLLAPSAAARDAALAALTPFGATSLYPTPLDAVPALRPALAGPGADGEGGFPGARDFCARLLTLPTHRGMRGARVSAAVDTLRRVAREA